MSPRSTAPIDTVARFGKRRRIDGSVIDIAAPAGHDRDMTAPDAPHSSFAPSPVLGSRRDEVARSLIEIACGAGEILRGYHGSDCPHQLKADGSPASLADVRSEAFIVDALARRFPGIPVVAEEGSANAAAADLFFLVDPLDGTRDFLAGYPEYSVNIGLISGGRPIASALAAPGLSRVWGAGTTAFEAPINDGRPMELRPIQVRRALGDGLVALVSRRHGDWETDACLDRLPIRERRVASSALKFCLIASGEADVYVRCAPTMEWDTAAGDHVLTIAGGCVIAPGGGGLTYGHHARFYRNGPFAALGDRSHADTVGLPSACATTYFDRRRAGEPEAPAPDARH